MDDKDRIGEAKGAEDALRPDRPGGARKTEGETDPDMRPAGTIDRPARAGDGTASPRYQKGQLSEQAAQRSGPVDIKPSRR